MGKTWCVYCHTSPSGKVYVGITHYKNPELRWRKDGVGYYGNTVFFRAIKKYGWSNFSHEILFRGCSEKLAKTLEQAYIKYFKGRNMSYNMTIGGDGHNLGMESATSEYRTNYSKKFREVHPDYDALQYTKHKEKKKASARKYYEENRESILEKKRNNIEAKNKSRIRAAEWRKKHPNYMKEYMKKYNSTKNN